MAARRSGRTVRLGRDRRAARSRSTRGSRRRPRGPARPGVLLARRRPALAGVEEAGALGDPLRERVVLVDHAARPARSPSSCAAQSRSSATARVATPLPARVRGHPVADLAVAAAPCRAPSGRTSRGSGSSSSTARKLNVLPAARSGVALLRYVDARARGGTARARPSSAGSRGPGRPGGSRRCPPRVGGRSVMVAVGERGAESATISPLVRALFWISSALIVWTQALYAPALALLRRLKGSPPIAPVRRLRRRSSRSSSPPTTRRR